MKKIFDYIYAFFVTACKLLLIITVVITAYLVFGRFVLHSQPVWGEEVVLMCITYMALISAALAIRDDSHMKMTVIEFLVPAKWGKRSQDLRTSSNSYLLIIHGHRRI